MSASVCPSCGAVAVVDGKCTAFGRGCGFDASVNIDELRELAEYRREQSDWQRES